MKSAYLVVMSCTLDDIPLRLFPSVELAEKRIRYWLNNGISRKAISQLPSTPIGFNIYEVTDFLVVGLVSNPELRQEIEQKGIKVR